MTDQHLIIPPRELVRQWIAEIWHEGTPVQVAQSDLHLANHAAQWGYDQRGEVNEAKLQKARDQELEGCYGWLVLNCYGEAASRLRDARRPEPPSLKEQALAVVENSEICDDLSIEHAAILRRALESLPD